MNLYSLLVNMEDLWTALEIMWKGVLAIAIVIALVIVVTAVVNKVCVKAENKKKASQENQSNGDSSQG